MSQESEYQVPAAERDLFSTELVAWYLDHSRFVPRPWLTGRVAAALDHPATRFVLVTGAPGTGKSALMAELARQSPGALRYFIRRDSANVLQGGDARTFLFSLGHQLAARRPALFEPDRLQLDVDLQATTIAAGGRVVGIEADELRASPFYQTALRVKGGAEQVEGELTGISAGQITLEPRLLELSNLQHLALLDPARALAEQDPEARIVVLVDALDEIRWGPSGESVLDWLVVAPELPANLRFVLSCRPDPSLLGQLRAAKAGELAEVALDPGTAPDEAARDELRAHLRDDLTRYFTAVAAEPALAGALTAHQVTTAFFVQGAIGKAQGNFQFAVALMRGIEAAMQPGRPGPELASLLRLQGVPEETGALYGFFLGRIAERLAGQTVPVPAAPGEEPARQDAWAGLYHPVLTALAVAFAPLSADQLRAYARVPPGPAGLDQALAELAQFLDRLADGRYRLYHASFPEWLTGEAGPPARVDAANAHALLAGRLRRANPDWLTSADRYALGYTPAHLTAAIRLWPDQPGRQKLTDDLTDMLGDPAYLLAATPDAVLPALLAVGTAGQATAAVYRQTATLLSEDVMMNASYLELEARRSGLAKLADRIADAVPSRPWQTLWSHGRRATGQVLTGHNEEVTAVAVGALPDGTPIIVSGDRDGTVRVWRLADGAPVGNPLPGDGWRVETVAVGRLSEGTPVIVAGNGWDHTVRVWRLADGAPVGDPVRCGDRVETVAVGALPDGTSVLVTGHWDSTVRVWRLPDDAPAGDPLLGHTRSVREVADAAPVGEPLRGHTDAVTKVALGALPDGTPVIITGSWDRTVRVWRLVDGTPVGKPLRGHTDMIYAVAVGALPDGTPVIVTGSDDTLRVWRMADGAPVGGPLHHTDKSLAVAVGALPDGTQIIASGGIRGALLEGTVRVWRMVDGTPVGDPLRGHAGRVNAVAVGALPDGTPVIITGSEDHTVRVWRLADDTLAAKPLSGHTDKVNAVAVGALPDGTPVIVTGSDDYTVRVWRLADGTPVGEPLHGDDGAVQAVAVGALPDGTPVIVSGGIGGYGDVYHAATVRVWRLADGTPVGEPLTGHDAMVTVVAVGALPDGTPVIVSGDFFGVVRVWRLADGTQVGDMLRGHLIYSAAAGSLPDGTSVIITGDARGGADHPVRVWRLADGTPVGEPLTSLTGSVDAVALGALPDGTQVIVTGSYGEMVRVWRLADGTPVGDARGPTGPLEVGALQDGTPVIVRGGDDGTVQVWRLADGDPVVPPLDLQAPVPDVAVHGNVIITAAGADIAIHQPAVLPHRGRRPQLIRHHLESYK